VISAIDIRRNLEATHALDADRGVFLSSQERAFAYSDGAAAEAYLSAAVRDARDVAVGSAELASRIRDWPSLYHLSPARQNLLRPVAPSLGNLILEIGAGCGAITRLLGESGATVLAVEGSLERATIAASRCRDMPNVVVVCDNFENLALPFRFDFVTLIGVLEYSRMFLAGADPVNAMLERAGALLADDGLLAVAIENQLGLKYLAGAREDHTGVAYFGVSDLYGPGTPVTFGEKEMRQRLARAGFKLAQCLYPFPDYKLASMIVTERGFADPALNVVDLVATTMGRHYPHEGPFAYSESLARGVFVRNGLGAATANSFLFFAGRSESARHRLPDTGVLAFAYSTARDRCYAKETRFCATPGGTRVIRRPLYRAAAPEGAPVRQRVQDEPYEPGEVMYRDLERIVARPGWSVDELVAWAQPLVDLLRSHLQPGTETQAEAPRAEPALPAAYFDCTPFNVIRRASDGTLAPFDLEWEPAIRESLSLAHVVFRGLWNSLARVDDVAAPADSTPMDIASLTIATIGRLGLPATGEQILEWVRLEFAVSNAVNGASGELPAVVPQLRVGGIGEHGTVLPRVASGLGGIEPGTGSQIGFRIQVYVAAGEQLYSEDTSLSVFAGGAGDRISVRIPLKPQEQGYTAIRFDPMDVPGLIRLQGVAVVNDRNEVVWETRRCLPQDFANIRQFRCLSRCVASSSGAIWFAEGPDPNMDLPIPPQVLGGLKNGASIQVEMGRLDASELSAVVKLAELAGESAASDPGVVRG
jgi:SAM-dependent methyltransferase